MRILIVEDDIVSSRVMASFLKKYGTCETAENGEEGIRKFMDALEEGAPYRLVALDIMMPGIDGQQVLKAIRDAEYARRIMGNDGARIIMTTALKDKDTILEAFRFQCEAYITKPIERDKLEKELEKLGIVKQPVA